MNQFPNLAVNKTYSLTMLHIAKVSDLAERMQVSQGEVMRQAIDLLWEKLNELPQQEPSEKKPAA